MLVLVNVPSDLQYLRGTSGQWKGLKLGFEMPSSTIGIQPRNEPLAASPRLCLEYAMKSIFIYSR